MRITNPRLPLAAVAVAALALSGCSSSAGDEPTGTAGISYQFVGPPLAGLNPAATGGTTSAYAYAVPAYSTLLSQRATGEIVGDLATDWGYREGDSLAFDVTLREDAVFADGTALDAAAVEKSLEYVRDAGFYLSSRFASFEDVETTGDTSLTIRLSEPVPDLPFLLTASGGAGFIIQPDALDDPSVLDNGTAGSGPYIYDAEQSVIDTTYVFTKNENYYNPEAVKADTLTVQVIGDPNTAVSALQTGQVDVAQGGAITAPAAESAGLDIHRAGGSVHALALLDREGTLVPALGDQRVRQAINLAIDRESLAESVLPGGYGVPTEQILAEGQPGYDPDLVGTYDLDRETARELLEDAGYGDGFDFSLLCSETVGNCLAAEAVASDLAEIGITVTIDPVGASTGAFDEKVASGGHPAAMQRMRTVATEFGPLLLPGVGGSANPFTSSDEEITRIWDEASAETDDAARADLYAELSSRVVDLAWFAPLYVQSNVYFTSKEVDGFLVTDENALYSPIDVTGEYTWTK